MTRIVALNRILEDTTTRILINLDQIVMFQPHIKDGKMDINSCVVCMSNGVVLHVRIEESELQDMCNSKGNF